jgi:hypothetical protein
MKKNRLVQTFRYADLVADCLSIPFQNNPSAGNAENQTVSCRLKGD